MDEAQVLNDWARAFLEQSSEIIWTCDVQGRITFANDAACRFFGYDRAVLLTLPITSLLAPDQSPLCPSDQNLPIFPARSLVKFRTGAGEIRNARLIPIPLRNAEHQVIGYQIILHDTTEQQRTLEQLKQRNEELAAINAIADILSNPRNFEQALGQVCEQIVSITGMESACIYFIDPSKQFLHLVAYRGISDQLYHEICRVGLDDPLAHYVAVEGKPFALDDVTAYQGPSLAGPRAAGYHAGIAVPIFKRDTPVGVLDIGSQIHFKYDPTDVNLLLTIGRQIGKALENAELYAQMEHRLEELDGIAKMTAACSATFDPIELSQIAVHWAYQLLGCDAAIVRLLHENKMYLAAHRSRHPVQLRPEIEIDDLFGPMFTQAHPLLIENVEHADLPMIHRQGFLSVGIHAIAILPLHARDRALGAIAIAYEQPHRWQPSELDLTRTIANHVAQAIEKAQLFQNVLSEQRKVQAIFDSGLSGLFATDAKGRITMFNHAAASITGWSYNEVLGKKWEDIFSDGTPDSEPLINDALYHKKTVFVQEGRKIRTRDGRVIPVAKAVAPLLDERDNITGAVGAFWDLSREQAAEMAREELLKEIAHQIRSPLTAVLSALQLLERPNLSPDHRAEMWTALKRDAQRLRRFADQILDLQTTLKSERPLGMEPLPIVVLVRTLVRSLRTQKSRHRFRIRSSSKHLLAFADEWRVENVLRNLLDNATTYSPAGTRVTITIQPTSDQMILIAVRDQGPGIPLEDQAKIFTPFYRSARVQKRATYGHGLGLAIAKRNVEEMGGHIWVESKEGHGATFYFTLRRYQ